MELCDPVNRHNNFNEAIQSRLWRIEHALGITLGLASLIRTHDERITRCLNTVGAPARLYEDSLLNKVEYLEHETKRIKVTVERPRLAETKKFSQLTDRQDLMQELIIVVISHRSIDYFNSYNLIKSADNTIWPRYFSATQSKNDQLRAIEKAIKDYSLLELLIWRRLLESRIKRAIESFAKREPIDLAGGPLPDWVLLTPLSANQYHDLIGEPPPLGGFLPGTLPEFDMERALEMVHSMYSRTLEHIEDGLREDIAFKAQLESSSPELCRLNSTVSEIFRPDMAWWVILHKPNWPDWLPGIGEPSISRVTPPLLPVAKEDIFCLHSIQIDSTSERLYLDGEKDNSSNNYKILSALHIRKTKVDRLTMARILYGENATLPADSSATDKAIERFRAKYLGLLPIREDGGYLLDRNGYKIDNNPTPAK